MATTDLLFAATPVPTPGPVDLVFGDDEAPAIAPVTLEGGGALSGLRGHVRLHLASTLHASGSISGLRGHATLRWGAVLHGAGQLSGLRGCMALAYNINVERPLVGRTEHRAQPAQAIAVPHSVRLEQTGQLSVSVLSHQQPAQALVIPINGQWQDSQRLRHATQVRAQQAQRTDRPTAQQWQDADAVRAATLQYVQQARSLHRCAAQGFEDAQRLRHAVADTTQQARSLHRPVQRHAGPARQWAMALSDHAQQATRPQSGARPPVVVPPNPLPCYAPQLPLELLFTDAADTTLPLHLLFTCASTIPTAQVVVPRRRAYIVINSITLHRLDTGAELRAHGFSMSLDCQSWTWQWSASLHHDAEGHLGRDAQGDPPVLVATVNGAPFRLLLEEHTRDRRFMPTRWAVSGRGLAATLSAPWAVKTNFGNTFDRTAQQLMQDVLTVNGVPLGWDLDWQITDWPVPARAWAMQGSYIEAITDIAGSVRSYVQPHNTDPVLRILPEYPHAPWDWPTLLTPDFDLPKEVGEVEGTKYLDKPAYNGIFVGGQGVGVFGPVTRYGTVGDVLAPQVLHPLITHADAHRQRGLAELSDTGTQEHISLTMQVPPETGVITPGKAVLYRGHDKNYLGIVRATSVNWQFPKLRQTLLLETHP